MPCYVLRSDTLQHIYWLCYFNSACNPIIYGIFNQDFREAFKKLVLKKK